MTIVPSPPGSWAAVFKDLVATVGFPAVVALYLLTRLAPQLEAVQLDLVRQRDGLASVAAACAPRTTLPPS